MTATPESNGRLDLVIRNGRVVDPASGFDGIADVGIAGSKIAAIAPGLPLRPLGTGGRYDLGTPVIDAAGALVVPGLVDLHTHVYTGVCPLTVPVDPTMALGGVTTAVSAGDAGASTVEGFRRLVVDRTRTRVFAFLHISRIGLVTFPIGESVDIELCDVPQAIRAVETHRDFVVGIKVRETSHVVGDNGLEPLRRALQVGEATGVPVMCHFGNTPTSLTEVLELLRPGDILTHCLTGLPNNLIENGRLVDGALAAKERGVVFDVGHGFGSFDFNVAQTAFDGGLIPDSISTDVHALSAASTMKDMPTTMSKLLHLGMPLEDVIRAVTVTPARAIGLEDSTGQLTVGGTADVAVLDLDDGEFEVEDTFGNRRTVGRMFSVRSTVRAGVPAFGPHPYPARDFTGPVH